MAEGMNRRGQIKRAVFLCCMCLSAIFILIFGLMIGGVSRTFDAIGDFCDRLEEADEYDCQVTTMNAGGSCADDCPHNIPGGAFKPGMFGLDDGKGTRQDTGEEIGTDWDADLVPPGKACTLYSPPGGTRMSSGVLQVEVARVDCNCFAEPLRVSVLTKGFSGGNRLAVGCVRVSSNTATGMPMYTGVHTVGCLLLPKTENFHSEIAIGYNKDSQIDKCKGWKVRFTGSSTYHWIYVAFTVMCAWTFLISCVGLLDQLYQFTKKQREAAQGFNNEATQQDASQKFAIPDGLVGGDYGGDYGGPTSYGASQETGYDAYNSAAPPAGYGVNAEPAAVPQQGPDDKPQSVDHDIGVRPDSFVV